MMDTGEAATALGALAQEKRLELLRLLLAAGPVGAAPGDLAAQLGHAELNPFVSSRRARTRRPDTIHPAGPPDHPRRPLRGSAKALAFLTETCCAGRPELCVATRVPAPTEETKGMTPAFNVLFLCTHNSARSIMAEAILAKIGGGRFQAYSAGSDPAAEPMPEVIEKLRALGHDVAGLRSKSWIAFTGAAAPRMDFVITLCDTLDGQVCPDFGDLAVTGAWPLPDPAKFTGSPAERSTLLNELYASLHRRLGIFTALPFATLDRMAMKARLDEDRRRRPSCPRRECADMRVGINGMGRIGRLALRAALGGLYRPADDPRAGNRLDVVHVNELKGGAATTAHLLEFDSVHGRWRERFGAEDDRAITIGNRRIGFSAAADAGRGALGRSRLRYRARMHRKVPQAGAA